MARDNARVAGIKLSRNGGYQNALLAVLFTAEGDVLVSVYTNLQDDIEVVPDMPTKCNRGMDVLYGVRKGRSNDKAFHPRARILRAAKAANAEQESRLELLETPEPVHLGQLIWSFPRQAQAVSLGEGSAVPWLSAPSG